MSKIDEWYDYNPYYQEEELEEISVEDVSVTENSCKKLLNKLYERYNLERDDD